MKNIISILLICLSIGFSSGQSSYPEAIKQGDSTFNKQQFKIAINKYFAAEAFDPTKKDIVKAKVNLAFDAIENLRLDTIRQRNRANSALQQALFQTKKSQSFMLTSIATEQFDKNPTLAIRLAELAWQISPTLPPPPSVQRIVVNSFYESIDSKKLFFTNNLEHNYYVRSAIFSSDGKKIAIAYDDNTVKIWLTPEGIIDWLSNQKNICQLTNKDLEGLGIDFIDLKEDE